MRFLLYPFSLIYGIIVGIRNFLFDYDLLPVKEFNVPVISVGNITVGGTGKTPHVEYLIKNLKDNFSIAVLSRGYKRKSKGFIEVLENMNVNKVGDEPLQIKRKFPEVTVAVDEKRAHGINHLLSENIREKVKIVILDDAYQHRFVKPGLSILLVDYNRLITEDKLLPFGRLREPASQKKRADIVLITKCPEAITSIERRIMFKEFKTFAYQNLYFTTFRYKDLCPLYKGKNISMQTLQDESIFILLITGIANTKSLVDFLIQKELKIKHLKFADHHAFSSNDLDNIKTEFERIDSNHKIILTTEKDAIRIKHSNVPDKLEQLPAYYIPIEVRFLNDDSENFNTRIKQYALANRRKE